MNLSRPVIGLALVLAFCGEATAIRPALWGRRSPWRPPAWMSPSVNYAGVAFATRHSFLTSVQNE